MRRTERNTRGLLRLSGTVVVVAGLLSWSGQREASSVAPGHAAAHGVEIRDAYATAVGSRLLAYFTVVNHTRRTDSLLGVLVGGVPAGMWHRHVLVTQSDFEGLRSCGGDPRDAQSAASLHWGAIEIPADRAVSLQPGDGSLDVGLARHSSVVRVEFDFDRTGSVLVALPIRAA